MECNMIKKSFWLIQPGAFQNQIKNQFLSLKKMVKMKSKRNQSCFTSLYSIKFLKNSITIVQTISKYDLKIK